jgi:hypothetical protein
MKFEFSYFVIRFFGLIQLFPKLFLISLPLFHSAQKFQLSFLQVLSLTAFFLSTIFELPVSTNSHCSYQVLLLE